MSNTKKLKGMLVNVLRNTLGDCTAGGVSSKFATMLLVGEGVPEIFAEHHEMPTLVLVKRILKWNADGTSQPYFHAEPKDQHDAGKWLMFGGNFVWTSDSRFRELVGGPIAVHDRCEG